MGHDVDVLDRVFEMHAGLATVSRRDKSSPRRDRQSIAFASPGEMVGLVAPTQEAP